jgi:hypothetical protein
MDVRSDWICRRSRNWLRSALADSWNRSQNIRRRELTDIWQILYRTENDKWKAAGCLGVATQLESSELRRACYIKHMETAKCISTAASKNSSAWAEIQQRYYVARLHNLISIGKFSQLLVSSFMKLFCTVMDSATYCEPQQPDSVFLKHVSVIHLTL